MEIKVPEVGESIHEAEIGQWHRQDGDRVEKGELICELETDKITLEVNADASGTLSIKVQQGETVEVGTVIGAIEESAETPEGAEKISSKKETKAKGTGKEKAEKDLQAQNKKAVPDEQTKEEEPSRKKAAEKSEAEPKPLLEKELEKRQPEKAEASERNMQEIGPGEEDGRTTRQRMSRIRQRIAERMMEARQKTAMLTTFNEADLSRVIELREKRGEQFREKHGVALGFMSFFVKASVEALKEFPEVNARIDGEEIVYQHFYDIGIAVGSDKGLVVPVVRDAEHLHFAEIEKSIAGFVEKVRDSQIELSDLEGGTFTITNGGVFGSLLSTPLLNPPQSAILGMHAIQKRPVVHEDQVVIRPMMYLALSYDHRIVDGREAVGFLKKVVEYIEEPEEMLLEM